MNPCKICNTHQEIDQSAEEFSYWIAREAEKEKNCPGYHYIESKVHKESYAEFSVEEWEELGRLIHTITQKINKEYHPIKIYTISIAEAVPHLHFHIVPRYNENLKGIDYLKEVISGKVP